MNVAVIGGGGHGRVIIDMIEKAGELTLVGVIDAQISAGEEVLGYPVLGPDSEIASLAEQHSIEGVVVAIGDNWIRSKAVAAVLDQVPQMKFPAVIHPSAQIARGVQFWRGSVAMAGAVVNTGSQIGEFCILNTNCSVDHDGVLGDFSSFGPNSCAGGTVYIGEFSAISLGANVIHNVKVGSHTVVGAGATAVSDLPSNVVAYGTPARVVRSREPGDSYL
jgi:sugar O-acyltransferase (sialic acid O-acetyltransferase NeuD family)